MSVKYEVDMTYRNLLYICLGYIIGAIIGAIIGNLINAIIR